jgi:NAD(P)H-hydrate epimerase
MALPIINLAQMRQWEVATWATGQTETKVIRRVGLCVAQRALQLTHPKDLILLLAGKGHNGDDVRAAQAHLVDRRVVLLNVKSPAACLPQLEAELGNNPALIIDGLLGTGLNRPLDTNWLAFISRLNGARPTILAVDVPSGLNAETGASHGAVVQATITLTLGTPKQGLFRASAVGFVGRLEVAMDIGLIPCPHTTEMNWTIPGDFRGFPPQRPVASHKGSYGHLAIIAGSVGFHGAAVLAARGAQRAQTGLLTVLAHELAYYPVASQLQSAMVNVWSPTTLFPGEFSALLIGPGLAAPDLPKAMRSATRKLWRDSLLPVVVDASALDWLPLDQVRRSAVRVITPHPGEAARMLKTTPAKVQENRSQAVREISKFFGNCWVVLKGHQTLIGRSTDVLFVNCSGNPHLAQGGSGDLLAGFIAGLLAQPAMAEDVGRTLRYAVWQHGATADALSARQRIWTVEDLAQELGNVI